MRMKLEDAVDQILDSVQVTEKRETVGIYGAGGRILSGDYVAQYNQPPFDRSPLDGYALAHEGLAGATEETPAVLPVSMHIFAGDVNVGALPPGTAARIMTGAMIPDGADCVIRQEYTDMGEESVRIYRELKAHDNICDKGEDVGKGMIVARRGEVVTHAEAALLAGQGYKELEAYKPLDVGIISTGSELVDGAALMPGQIFNSNGPMVALRLHELHVQSREVCVNDDPVKIRRHIEDMLNDCDAVITTGGVSVGDKDYMPQVLKEMGAEIVVRGVAMKPGGPVTVASFAGKLIFALSGNPFAALATLELIALPALLKQQGCRYYRHRPESARLMVPYPKISKGRRFLRGTYHDGYVVMPGVDSQVSGSISGLKECNCLIDISPENSSVSAGSIVRVFPFLTLRNDAPMEVKLPLAECVYGEKRTTGRNRFSRP